jgi:site-specific DNA-cytosine methylase
MNRSKIKVLVACEYSGTVRDAFLELGFNAWSCDILPCESDIQDRHYEGDVFDILDQGWDLMIGHPPCTHLSVSGARWFTEGKKPWHLRDDAIEFVQKLMDAPIKHIAIENPVSVISSYIRKSDQMINPYQFGHKEYKRTCLWLKDLPKLTETDNVKEATDKLHPKEKHRIWWIGSGKGKERSMFYTGIAKAMADQWGTYIEQSINKEIKDEV